MPCGKHVFVAAEEFPNQSFYPIAKNSITRFFCDGDSDAPGSIRVAAYDHGKELRTSSDPLFVNNLIAAFIRDFFRSSERLFFHV
jgi:hypothetical protein